MKQRGLIVVAAFVLAAAATGAVFAYVHSVKQNVSTGSNLVQVIVSKQDIPAGTSLSDLVSSGAFETEAVPKNALVPGAVTSLSQLQTQRTSLPILAHEQISTARLTGGALAGGTLGIPRGLVAVSLSLDPQNLVNNEVKQGDRVTIYASFAGAANAAQANAPVPGVVTTLVPQALVLQGPASTTVSGGAGLLTLALTPQDAQRVIFTQQQGSIWLGLLPPGQAGVKAAPSTYLQVIK